ncbi:MAG: sulfite exporter TauE/SafE family protein [Granulosicoccus sp.]
MPADLAPLNIIILIAVSFVTSAISATFGLGGGIALLIALLSFVPPIIALPVHALVQLGSNAGRAWILRPHIMKGVLQWFIPGTLLGVFLASQIVFVLPTTALQLLLALFILWSIWAPRLSSIPVSEKHYLGVGGITSFATMFLGATGPLLAVFLSPERYGRDRTVATHAACMSMQHLVKIIAFGFLGVVLLDWMPLVLAMVGSGLVGTWIGAGLLRRIPEASFKIAFKAVLTLLAVRLLYKALVG